jgi:hypothetical protein
LEEDFLVPVTSLATNEPGTVYVAFKNTSGAAYPTCNFTNILKFTSKEIDPSTGEPDDSGYDDEYQIEDLDLGGSDFVVPAFAGSWEGVWDAASGGDEASETLVLGGIKSIAGMTNVCCDSKMLSANSSKMPLLNSPTSSNSNRWMEVMSLFTIRHINSNCTVRVSMAAKWPSWYEWLSLQSLVLRYRFGAEVRKKVWLLL